MIELLVVVGILGVLAAILLPALSASRRTARRVKCLGNLRQMAIAAQEFLGDNAESYPIAYSFGVENGVTYAYAWDLTTMRGPTSKVIPGLLWQGSGLEQIQQCPAFRGSANWLVDPYTGYNYNTSYIGHGQHESVTEPARVSTVRQPAGTVLFGDG